MQELTRTQRKERQQPTLMSVTGHVDTLCFRVSSKFQHDRAACNTS